MNTPQLYNMVPIAPSQSTGPPVKSFSKGEVIVLMGLYSHRIPRLP
jgi:hypothetical protein